jgi:hypothetical protein
MKGFRARVKDIPLERERDEARCSGNGRAPNFAEWQRNPVLNFRRYR